MFRSVSYVFGKCFVLFSEHFSGVLSKWVIIMYVQKPFSTSSAFEDSARCFYLSRYACSRHLNLIFTKQGQHCRSEDVAMSNDDAYRTQFRLVQSSADLRSHVDVHSAIRDNELPALLARLLEVALTIYSSSMLDADGVIHIILHLI